MAEPQITIDQDVAIGPQGVSIDTHRLGPELGGLLAVFLMALVFKYIWRRI